MDVPIARLSAGSFEVELSGQKQKVQSLGMGPMAWDWDLGESLADFFQIFKCIYIYTLLIK